MNKSGDLDGVIGSRLARNLHPFFLRIEGNELSMPQVAREFGLKTLVGAWLGKDKDLNEQEIAGLIELAKQGQVDIAAVGNEVLYRKDLNEEELLDYLHRLKSHRVPVGYVDALL
ncbi:MAG: hypothetical protein R2788_09485 [Saprospiraceae bacterium]